MPWYKSLSLGHMNLFHLESRKINIGKICLAMSQFNCDRIHIKAMIFAPPFIDPNKPQSLVISVQTSPTLTKEIQLKDNKL